MKKSFPFALLGAIALFAPGCESRRDGPLEDLGEDIDDAADDIGDEIEDAFDD